MRPNVVAVEVSVARFKRAGVSISLLPILLAGCSPLLGDERSSSPVVVPAMRLPSPPSQEEAGLPPIPSPAKESPAHDRLDNPSVEVPPNVSSSLEPGPLTGLLVGRTKHDLYMRFWPRGKEPERVRQSQPVLFYDEAAMPTVYQVFDMGVSGGVFRADGPQATVNREFPWNLPAGIPSGSNVKTIRFIQIPEGRPVLWWRSTYTDGTFARFRWVFQEGTRLGEILLVTDSRGFDRTFEMRTRLKTPKGWRMQAYRPFPQKADLEAALEQRGLFPLQTPIVSRSVDSTHRQNAFAASALMQRLPRMTEETVNDLLDTAEFQPALGIDWDVDVAAPTADSYSVVPRGYLGAFIPVANDSCMRCHVDAGEKVGEPQLAEIRWRNRGQDGIFSFHVFEPSSIGTSILKLNAKLVNSGLLRHMEGMP